MTDITAIILILITAVGFIVLLVDFYKNSNPFSLLFACFLLAVIIVCGSKMLDDKYKNNSKDMKEESKSMFVDIEKQYKNYSRNFIRINPNEIMLIHMFKRDVDHQLEDVVLDDNQQYYEDITRIRKEAAHQLVLQFEGHSSRSFIKALKEECEKWLEENNKRR